MTDLILNKENLPANVDELHRFILIGEEALIAHRAKIRAISKLEDAHSAKQATLKDGQSVGEAVLWAKDKLGEMLEDRPTTSSWEGTSRPLPPDITKKQSHYYQQIHKNRDIVKEVITDAAKNDDVPTTKETLKRIQKKNRKQESKQREQDALKNLSKEQLWVLTDNQAVIECSALITDPPYGILKEPWEPKDLELFTRNWLTRWNDCQADFILSFWSQEYLWIGRKWFDESLMNYTFQQLLIWHYRNNKSPQSRMGFKQTWEPIFFYRKNDSSKEIRISGSDWGDELNDFDCHVAPVPQSNFNGVDMKQHPGQKPISVFRWLINATTKPGEMISDPFAGSGTSGIAATQLSRYWHGIENNKEYLEIAKGRLALYGK